MEKVLWISQHLPYDTVDHAGGKIQNFYINKLIDSNCFDVRLLSFYWDRELPRFTLDKKIICYLVPYHSDGIKKLARNILDLESQRNPLNKYGNLTSRYLKTNILRVLHEEKKKGYIPDIIILQWTQTIFFAQEIKEVFPDVRIIGIEEDVSFLNYERRIDLSNNSIVKLIAKKQYANVRKEEINALDYCDIVICNNQKDRKMLLNAGFEGDIKVWAPYFQSFDRIDKNEKEFSVRKSIVFYGDMSRPENYLSAEWFIDHVMPLLAEENVVFDIIGGRNPDKSLFEYESCHKNVKVHGFVDNIDKFFSEGLCLTAPLLYGAGIKIKVLEAMSSGLPVLTNDIGIEGIPAQNMVDFLYCKAPEDYAKNIRKLLADMEFRDRLSNNSRELIRKYYNYEKSAEEFISWLRQVSNPS